MDPEKPGDRAGLLVDIIMPTYSPDLGLMEKAIDSAIAQTYRDWRMVVAMDGPDDGVKKLVDKKGDPRITAMEMPHRGKSSTVNEAIEKTSGRFIAYLDDDDVWYPNHIEVCMDEMAGKGLSFVHTDVYEIQLLKKVSGSSVRKSKAVMNMGPLTDIFLWRIGHTNVMHERWLYEKVGSYDPDRKYYIDWDMFLRFADVARPVHIPVITGEHYIFLDAEGKKLNRISRVHDQSETGMRFREMILRSKHRLTDDDMMAMVDEMIYCRSMSWVHLLRRQISGIVKPRIRGVRDLLSKR